MRAVGLQDAAALGEPGAREAVVVGKAGELVPVVVDAVDDRVVGPQQVALELEIVGRVGEDEIDALVGQLCQLVEAIADEDAIGRQAPPAHDDARTMVTQLSTLTRTQTQAAHCGRCNSSTCATLWLRSEPERWRQLRRAARPPGAAQSGN